MIHVCTCDDCSLGRYEDECKYEAELTRVREENEAKSLLIKEGWTKYDAARRQRDTLLAALRKWFHDDGWPRYNSLDTTDWIHAMAPDIRAAISEVEGEKPNNHVHGFSNNPPRCRSEVEGEK